MRAAIRHDWLVGVAFYILSLATPGWADPAPITLDASNKWVTNEDAEFSMSDFTLNVRRFAPLPQVGAIRPQPRGVLTIPGDDRLFVVLGDQRGNKAPQLLEMAPDGSTASSIFAPWPSSLFNVRDIVFHPQFLEKGTPGYGKLYTLTTVTKPRNPAKKRYLGDRTAKFGDNLLAEWSARFDSSGKFDGVDPDSYREVFRVARMCIEHPIGQGKFNPFAKPGDDDYGLLYLTIGDSFAGSAVSQNGQSALGKTLRINPLEYRSPSHRMICDWVPQVGFSRFSISSFLGCSRAYSIPADNPFVNDPAVLDEIYTIGHRNPHSLSFAKDPQGEVHILIAEPGEYAVDEINLVSQGGGNYGWAEREGTIDRSAGLDTPGSPCDATPRSDATKSYGLGQAFVYPVAQYGHDDRGDGTAVAGGYVVNNGSGLDGQYFFVDFPGSGDVFTIAFEDILNARTQGAPEDLTPLEIERVNVLFDDDDDPSTPGVLTNLRDIITDEEQYDGSGRLDIRFAQGAGGELYILNKRNGWMYLVTNSLAPRHSTFGNDE